MSANSLSSIQAPLMLLACLLIPALALFFYTSKGSGHKNNQHAASSFDWALSENDLQQASEFDATVVAEHPLDIVLSDESDQTRHSPNVSPAYLETVEINQLSHDSTQEAMNDADTSQAHAAEVTSDLSSDLKNKLQEETRTRIQTEKHLRVTRKALSILEASTRDNPNDSSELIIELEESLAKSLETSASLESKAISEQTKRIRLERKGTELKKRLMSAKTEIRRSAAARAKALGTANQSIALARQSVKLREQLEAELRDANKTLKNQQTTISSLIRALEKEKRRTQDEISSSARQLMLHEKQVRTRRSMEAVARSVENKLASRLVKKVAKARPLMSDVNHGEPGL